MMTKTESYKNFEISWHEPPIVGGKWSCNVASNDSTLYSAMVCHNGGEHGAKVIEGSTRDNMRMKAREFIDQIKRG